MQAHLKRLWVIIFGLIGLMGLSLLFFAPRPMAETPIKTGYSNERFLKQMAPEVTVLAKSYGIKPSLLLAHLAIETDFGQTLLFQKYHNAYGLKPKSGQSQIALLTKTYQSSDNPKTRRFATYSHWQESLRDYLARLKADQKAAYRVLATTDAVKEAAGVLAELSHRQQENYAKELTKIISSYHLTQYDK